MEFPISGDKVSVICQETLRYNSIVIVKVKYLCVGMCKRKDLTV